jgi:hypothetical protein
MESFTNYEDLIKQIPQKVSTHLKGLIKESKLPDGEETMKNLSEAWLLKRALFYKMTEHENFTRTESMSKDNKNGCIAITMSGSIIAAGPLVNDKRDIKYTSIGIRTDVPETLHVKAGRLARDVVCGQPMILEKGPLEKTSPIMDLAVSTESMTEQEQLEIIKKVNKKLQTDFIKVNKDVLAEEEKQDTIKKRNDLFQKWIIIQWFILGGMEKHIFMARARILWLELFTKVYKAVTKMIKNSEQRDNDFLDFTNNKFAKFVDDYKWYESEKKNFDIGLLKALEELPDYQAYLEFADNFCSTFHGTKKGK